MKRKNKLILAGMILVGSTLFGVEQHKGMVDAEANLRRYPAYVEAIELRSINSRLGSAKFELKYADSYTTYTKVGDVSVPFVHPEEYPNAAKSRDLISSTLEELEDRENLDDRLMEIYNSLPNQNDIRKYEGKRVNNSTFKNQRKDIEAVREEIGMLEDTYMNDVPDDLKSKKNKYILGFIVSIIAGFGSVVLGISGLEKEKYY